MNENDILLDECPYPPFEVTFTEQKQCHDLSFTMLQRTLRSYEERLAGITPRHHANLDSARWKLQKTQDNASLYAERIRRVRTDLHLPGDNWMDPTVLMMSGTIQASLDVVMFGLAIPTFADLKIRISTLENQEVNGAMLAKLVGASDNDPFRNSSIIYVVTQLPWLVSKVVKPRDFLLLSTSGMITTANGERIGYDLLQPAPLPQCRPLPKPIIRGKFMMARLFRQQEDGNVDVYIHQYVEVLGKVMDSFVINNTWKSCLGVLSSPLLAEHKKLRWCIANTNNVRRRGLASKLTDDSMSCYLCSVVGPSRRNDQQTCVLCLAPVCPHCREGRSFKVLEQQSKEKSMLTKKRQVHVCRPCLEFVRRHKPADIARYNNTADQVTRISNATENDKSIENVTWGVFDSDLRPTWPPSQSLTMLGDSFESFG